MNEKQISEVSFDYIWMRKYNKYDLMEKDIIEYHFPIVFFFVEIEVNIPFQKKK